MSKSIPIWRLKHPCEICGTGYGLCIQGLARNLMCCSACRHPTRWMPNPWTRADVIEMWDGLDMPIHIQKMLDSLEKDVTDGL